MPYEAVLDEANLSSRTPSDDLREALWRLVMKRRTPTKFDDFVSGGLDGTTVMGLPARLVTGVDGAVYIADDNNGFIYRVAPRLPAAVGGGAPDGEGRSGVLWR